MPISLGRRMATLQMRFAGVAGAGGSSASDVSAGAAGATASSEHCPTTMSVPSSPEKMRVAFPSTEAAGRSVSKAQSLDADRV